MYVDSMKLTEQEVVFLWRTGELELAGFSPVQATALAVQDHVDLHQATDLLAKGCPPELAVQILL